ncbi:MAG: ABC transporter ATP-binding protein [Burkholderiaceae bacterium]|nr:ABC transporter ATP-binding protein [Burkholderiaceae bacterium]MEB2317681.1 ABC transporter ATP-binding protein [Pseudomonadota bacterium]
MSARASGATALHRAPVGPAALSVSGLDKRFGGHRLLASVSLEIAPGERVVLLGESGSGKSTLLNLIAGLEPADAGTIHIAGQRVDGGDADTSAALRRTRLGFVFQAFHLLPQLDALANVMVPLLLLGTSYPEARRLAQAQLESLGIAARARALPAMLSGGEQQRVAIARALVHRPTLLLADEPTGNLDEENAQRVLELLETACHEHGAALLMATHSAQAARAGTRVLRLAHASLHHV